MATKKTPSTNVYKDGKSFRVKFIRKGKTFSKNFPSRKEALEYRMKKLGF